MFFWILIILLVILARFMRSLLSSRRLPPGPIGLPIIGNLHMLGDLPHRTLHKLSKTYGPIMSIRLGLVTTVVVSSPQAAELFLKTYDDIFASRPRVKITECLSYGNKGLAFSPNDPYWRNVRKLCTLELLTSAKVEQFSTMRQEEVKSFVILLGIAAKAKTIVDLSTMVQSVIQDMTFRMLFGNKNDMADFKPIVKECVRVAGKFNIADYIPYIGALHHQRLVRSFKATGQVLDKYLEEIIEEHGQNARKEGTKNHNDFVDILLSLMESGEYWLERDNVKAIVLDMIIASMDTSSTTIEWTFSELIRHPRVIKCVQDELWDIYGNQMVNEKEIPKLRYLDMVVKEILRLHPSGPLLVPHESIQDVTVNGYFIPKKSRIVINAFAIGRDPMAWSQNAEEFYPERFVGNDVNFQGKDFHFIPFGSGRRSCPGTQMGLAVVKLVLAQLLHCFNWELPRGMLPQDLNMDEKFGLTVSREKHLLLIPTPRLTISE